MQTKDYSLLINKTFRDPITGKTYKIKDIRPDRTVELTETDTTLHIETILNNWQDVTESTLICG